MAKAEMEFFDPSEIPWEPDSRGAVGMYVKILSRDADTGDFTSLQRLDPGCDTSAMGVQLHDYWEESWIISGTLFDISLGTEFNSGQYACRPPGMRHGPWRSPGGCLTFQVCYYDK